MFFFCCCLRKTTEFKCISITSHQGYKLSTHFITVHIESDHLAEVVFVRFCHYKVNLFLPLFRTVGWKSLWEHIESKTKSHILTFSAINCKWIKNINVKFYCKKIYVSICILFEWERSSKQKSTEVMCQACYLLSTIHIITFNFQKKLWRMSIYFFILQTRKLRHR